MGANSSAALLLGRSSSFTLVWTVSFAGRNVCLASTHSKGIPLPLQFRYTLRKEHFSFRWKGYRADG